MCSSDLFLHQTQMEGDATVSHEGIPQKIQEMTIQPSQIHLSAGPRRQLYVNRVPTSSVSAKHDAI